jgi:serine protein kinase
VPAAERLLRALGEPVMADTSQDARLGRIFMNRTIKMYPGFADFFEMEETIERIVGLFRHATQGLDEGKQILCLLGPVSCGNLARRQLSLARTTPGRTGRSAGCGRTRGNVTAALRI